MTKEVYFLKYILLFELSFYAPVALCSSRTRMGMTFSQFFLLQAVLSISIFIFEVPCGYITVKSAIGKHLF